MSAVELYLGNVVKFSKKFVEHNNQLFGRACTRQLCEAHDVCIQDTTQEIVVYDILVLGL